LKNCNEAVQKNDEVNKPFEKQSKLHEELILIDLEIRENKYRKDLNNE